MSYTFGYKYKYIWAYIVWYSVISYTVGIRFFSGCERADNYSTIVSVIEHLKFSFICFGNNILNPHDVFSFQHVSIKPFSFAGFN